jgi:hypothetical protein
VEDDAAIPVVGPLSQVEERRARGRRRSDGIGLGAGIVGARILRRPVPEVGEGAEDLGGQAEETAVDHQTVLPSMPIRWRRTR